MKSLKSLTEYLRSLQLINDDAFDSFAVDGTLEPSSADLRSGFDPAVLLFRQVYTAEFSWENWHGDAAQLFAIVYQWLIDHDYDFDEHGFPAWSCYPVDDSLVDVELRIKFVDPVYCQPFVTGDLPVLLDSVDPVTVTSINRVTPAN